MEMVTQIREDIQRLKVEATEPRFEFTLWESTDCDEVYDFKYYFPKYNSNQLDQKYSLLHKSLRKKWPKRFI